MVLNIWGKFKMTKQNDQIIQSKKLDFLNLIKLMIVFPGVTYHVSEYLNFPEPLIEDHWFVNIFTTYARVFYYTAFIATLAVFYPIGIKPSKKIFTHKRIGISILGLLFLSYIYYDKEAPFFNSEWTFYHFVLISFIVLHFLLPKLKNKFINLTTFAISFLFLCIPFWKFEFNQIPYAFKIALIGDCTNSAYGEWPLLPWIFLPLISVSYCQLLENNSYSKTMNIFEMISWPVVIMPLGYLYWGSYFDKPTDINFSCGVFTQHPLIFYAHIIPYFFIIRLNYISSIREKLSRNKFFLGLQNISWINNFGSCYLLSLLTMGILSLLYNGSLFPPGLKHFMFICSIFVSILVPETLIRTLKSKEQIARIF